jgi:hypothetical protein
MQIDEQKINQHELNEKYELSRGRFFRNISIHLPAY